MAEVNLQAKISGNAEGLNKAVDETQRKIDKFVDNSKDSLKKLESSANTINLKELGEAFGKLANQIDSRFAETANTATKLVGGILDGLTTGNWTVAIAGGIGLIAAELNRAKKEAEEFAKQMEDLQRQKQAAQAQSYTAEAGALTRLNSLNSGAQNDATRAEIARLVGLLNEEGFGLSLDASGRAVGVPQAFAHLESLQNEAANKALYGQLGDLGMRRTNLTESMAQNMAKVEAMRKSLGEVDRMDPRNAATAMSMAILEDKIEEQQRELDIVVAKIGATTQQLHAQQLQQELSRQAPGMIASENLRLQQERNAAEEATRKQSTDRVDEISAARAAALKEFNALTDGGRKPRGLLSIDDRRRADSLADQLRNYDRELAMLSSMDNSLKQMISKVLWVQEK